MLNEAQAQVILRKTLPGYPVKAMIKYKDLFLFRVEHPDPLEKDWDPFFSVDPVTEEVRDFSVITDGNLSEINNLDWKEF
jgi:hypothetical protein